MKKKIGFVIDRNVSTALLSKSTIAKEIDFYAELEFVPDIKDYYILAEPINNNVRFRITERYFYSNGDIVLVGDLL